MRKILAASLMVSIMATPFAAWSNETLNKPQYTYQGAVELAKANSYKLKNTLADIEANRERLEKAGDRIEYTPVGTADNYNESLANAIFTNWARANINYQSSQKQLTITEDSLEYSVHKAYNDVLQAEEKVKVDELTLKDLRNKMTIANAKFRLGMASEYDYNVAKSNYETQIKTLETSKQSLQDSRQIFRTLLGVQASQDFVLTETPRMEKIKAVDLETYVNQIIDKSTSIWQKEQNVTLAKMALDLYTFNDSSNPETYKSKEIELEKAINDESNAKRELAKSLRTLYYNIQTLEQNYDMQSLNLKKAEDSLKVIKARHSVGMVTDFDVIEAELSVEKIRKQLFDLAAQHHASKIAFEKPWVLGY